jgi:hypothetical protein
LPKILQFVDPSGGQVGTGITEECMDEEAIVLAEADDVWVEAAAPVRARTTTNARTMIFMVLLLRGPVESYFVDCAGLAAEVTIRSDRQ